MYIKRSSYSRFLSLIGAISLIGVSHAALAAVELELVAQRQMEVTDSKGNTTLKLVTPKPVVPGDTVVYTIRYHNDATTPAENVVISNPVPKNTTYIGGSATGTDSGITYSIDGGKNFDLPDKLFITGTNGKKHTATAKDYTHIRWLIKSLPPKARGEVTFHVKVN